MQFKGLKILVVVALVASLGMPLVLQAAGFGVTPVAIIEDKLVPGSTIEKTIFLVQGNPESDIPIIAEVDAPRIADWFSFPQGQEITIPAGVQQFPFKVHIEIPQDADLGIYKGFLRIRTNPDAATTGGTVSVAVGARVDIDLTVGDDVIVEYNIKTLDILDIKERDPLQVAMMVENTGNVNAGPDSASFELFDRFGNIRLAFITVDDPGFVEAFSEERIVMEFPLDTIVAPGQYRGHVKVYDEEGKIIRQLNTAFDIFERTPLDLLFDYLPYIVIGILVLVVILIFVFRRRKPSHTPHTPQAPINV